MKDFKAAKGNLIWKKQERNVGNWEFADRFDYRVWSSNEEDDSDQTKQNKTKREVESSLDNNNRSRQTEIVLLKLKSLMWSREPQQNLAS